jgi:hypothetical protein
LGIFDDENLLIVVSPFRRTLQTLLGIMESFGTSWKYRTIIQPMCGEYYKGVGGDVGTNRSGLEQLYPKSEYPSFDFSTLDDYCRQWENTKVDGSWWCHGTSLPLYETMTIQQRGILFRNWLAATCDSLQTKQVLLVSHGGILRYTFPLPQSPKYENCEVKVFDLYYNGSFERAKPILHQVNLEIKSVRDINYNTCTYFEITGKVCGINFIKVIERMSDLKTNIYNLIDPMLISKYFTTPFPIKTSTPTYGGFFSTSTYNWQNLKQWLVELSHLLNQDVLKNEVKYRIVCFLLSRY